MEKILESSKIHGFIKAVTLPKLDDIRPSWFHFGPAGELLAQNLQNEWIYSNVTAREPSNVFQHYSPGKSHDIMRK